MKIAQIEDKPTKKLNRWTAKRPRKGLFWCWKCDRELVGKGTKCPACGAAPRVPGMRKKNNL